MADAFDFEARLEARLQARAAVASRPFDATEIAHKAIATGARRRGIGRIAWPFARRSLVWMVVVLLLVIALLGALTFAGALLRRTLPPGGSRGWVAFAVQGGTRCCSGPGDIYLVENGVAERRIIGSDGDGLRQVCPAFSPDGTRLAYSEAPELPDVTPTVPSAVVIVTLGADGLPVGPALRLPTPPSTTGDVCPKWAPDGQSVAFLQNQQNPQLWIGRLDGTETQVVASEAINLDGLPGQFDWSPDGTAIVVVGYDSTSLWIVPLGAGQARLLPGAGRPTSDRPSDQAEPKWSPDGSRIAVVQTTWSDVSGGQTATGSSIEVYRADGSGPPIELGTASTLASGLAWSPDGDRIAYVDGDRIADVRSTESGELNVMASDPNGIGGFVWSHDGTRLVYVDVANQGPSGALVSVSAVGDPAPFVLTQQGHDFEFEGSEDLSWQPVFP